MITYTHPHIHQNLIAFCLERTRKSIHTKSRFKSPLAATATTSTTVAAAITTTTTTTTASSTSIHNHKARSGYAHNSITFPFPLVVLVAPKILSMYKYDKYDQSSPVCGTELSSCVRLLVRWFDVLQLASVSSQKNCSQFVCVLFVCVPRVWGAFFKYSNYGQANLDPRWLQFPSICILADR